MKNLILYLVIIIAGFNACAQSGTSSKKQEKLNVVFFLVDDLGWSDIGCYGSSFYETPNIDRFAKDGVRFTQAYAACHVCSPTRASILTGKYPARIGLTDWLPGRKNFPFQKLKNAVVKQHLPFEDSTLAETLRANGYHTAIFGKWHLGEDSSNPLYHGFDQRMPDWDKGWPLTYFYPFRLKGLEGKEGDYLTDRMTDEAIKYIDQNKGAPFFLYMAHFAVHDPIQGRPDLVKKYEDKLKNMPARKGPPFILEANPDTSNQLSRKELDELLKDDAYKGFKLLPNRSVKIKQYQDNPQFAAMVESMDESLGRILSKLKELKLDGKTIIIFASDNGGMSAANFGKPSRIIKPEDLDKAYSTSNLPLRGGKGWFYEGGIRVPMIVKWPQHGKKGIAVNVPVISTDFYPTILDMLGLPLQPGQHMDGVSLTPLLEGKKKIEDRALYWHFPQYSNHGLQSPGGAIRYGDYKLIEYFENNTVQLFNIKTDIGEHHDLSKSKPEKVRELRDMLHAWRKSVSAQMEEPNPDYVR